jgi:hypothetical protein
MAIPSNGVKFGPIRFLDLYLKRCSLGTSVDKICRRFPPPSHLPREATRGVFFDVQSLITIGDVFCHNGAQTAGPNGPQNCGDQMDYEDNQIPHPQMLPALNYREFSLNWNSPGIGLPRPQQSSSGLVHQTSLRSAQA